MRVHHIKVKKLVKGEARDKLRNKYPGISEDSLEVYDYLMKRKKKLDRLNQMLDKIFGDCKKKNRYKTVAERNKAIREYEKAKKDYAEE